MTERVAVRVKHLAASGQVFGNPCYLKAICTVTSTGAAGTVYFYNMASAPEESDTPVCEIDVDGKGTFPFYVPEPGALFDKGLYVELPESTKINFFFTAV
jgi:hypothetical protein